MNYINNFTEKKIHLYLRIAIFMCFVGHGFWGLMQKKGWLVFFDVFNIDHSVAYFLMPLIGLMDILIGFIAFFRPNKAILLWAAIWATFTALLRPAAGMGFSEFFERAGNFIPPIAFLYLLHATQSKFTWTQRIRNIPKLTQNQIITLEKILRWGLFSLLMGHAGLAIFQFHPTIAKNFTGIGILLTRETMAYFGYIEAIIALLVLFVPSIRGLMWGVLIFKLATEILFPIAGTWYDIFETIERGGDYLIPLLLIFIYKILDQYYPQTNGLHITQRS